jgi:hypothetical protein
VDRLKHIIDEIKASDKEIDGILEKTKQLKRFGL